MSKFNIGDGVLYILERNGIRLINMPVSEVLLKPYDAVKKMEDKE